ncbi:MAG: type II secretion system protein GspM [Gemmatimonadota bacterium]|nr:type II secretion system protein GspM [Gemmatimonadota bacterium]
MRIPPLSPRDRRAVGVGAILLGPLIVWVGVVSPYLRGAASARERLTAERELLARETELVAGAAAFAAAWGDGSQRLLAAAPRLFAGENPAVATAVLARYLHAASKMSRVLLTQVEPAPPVSAGPGLLALPLRVEGETDLEGIMSLLYTLEGGLKLVRVEGLHLRGLRTAGAMSPQEPAVVHFSFTATGYAFSDAAASEAPARLEEGGP